MKRILSAVLIVVLLLSMNTFSENTWACSSCGREGNRGTLCGGCGMHRPEEMPEDETWTCPSCGKEGNTSKFCPDCAAPKQVPVDPDAWNGFLENVHYTVDENVLCLIKGCEAEHLEEYIQGLTEVLEQLVEAETWEVCIYTQDLLGGESFTEFVSKLDGRSALSEASAVGLLNPKEKTDSTTFLYEIRLAVVTNALPLYIYIIVPEEPKAEEPEKPTYTLNTVKAANVRSGPGLSFNMLGSINAKQTVSAYELVASSDFSGNWYRIEYNGQVGYISVSTVESAGGAQPMVRPGSATPTVAPTPTRTSASVTATPRPTLTPAPTPTPKPGTTNSAEPQPTHTPTSTAGTGCQHNLTWVSIGEQTHQQVCSKCSYVSQPSAHGLSYVSDGKYGHHPICTLCGFTGAIVPQSHQSDKLSFSDRGDTCLGVCAACGYSVSASHVYNKCVYVDANTHQRNCSMCGHTGDLATHNVSKTCIESQNVHVVECNMCHYQMEVYEGAHPNNQYSYAVTGPHVGQHALHCLWCWEYRNWEEHTYVDGVCSKCGSSAN